MISDRKIAAVMAKSFPRTKCSPAYIAFARNILAEASSELTSAAREALDAYESRFNSTTGVGNFTGPIDEEMKALRKALP